MEVHDFEVEIHSLVTLSYLKQIVMKVNEYKLI